MIFDNKTILITGGLGFFGQKFAEVILKDHNPKSVRIYGYYHALIVEDGKNNTRQSRKRSAVKRKISSSPITARIRRFENLDLSGYEPLKVFSHLYLDVSDEQTLIFIQNVFGKYNENGVEEYGILAWSGPPGEGLSILGAFSQSTVSGLELDFVR